MSEIIIESVLSDALKTHAKGVPALSVVVDNNALAKALALSIVSGLGNEAVDEYLSDTTLPEQQIRGRSKKDAAVEVEEPEIETMEPIARPNGELYYPRNWGSRFDVDVIRKARSTNKYVLVQGEPGTGKTALGEAAYGEDSYTVMISGDTEVSELVGQWVPKPEGGFAWVDGPLLRAAEEGKALILDEIGLADPKVLSVLYSFMDGRRELLVTQNPTRGIVRAVDGFFVYAATNPHAPGVRLSEALLSRFAVHAEITTDYEMATTLGVPKKVVSAAQNLAQRKNSGSIDWAPQFRELFDFRDLAKIYDDKFAYENMIASAPERDRQAVREVLLLVSGFKDLKSAAV